MNLGQELFGFRLDPAPRTVVQQTAQVRQRIASTNRGHFARVSHVVAFAVRSEPSSIDNQAAGLPRTPGFRDDILNSRQEIRIAVVQMPGFETECRSSPGD